MNEWVRGAVQCLLASLKHCSLFSDPQEKEMEKQRLLYQQSRLHNRGAAEMVLQMISACKGRGLGQGLMCFWATISILCEISVFPWITNCPCGHAIGTFDLYRFKVLFHRRNNGNNLSKSDQLWDGFAEFLFAGEPGAMVSSTLKLGISILNGGNSDVQQVKKVLAKTE